MITGGAFQGKTRYTVENLHISDLVNGADCDFINIKNINGYHILVRRLMENGIDPIAYTERFCRENPDSTVIIDEIGCGIIPMEKEERQWRGAVGRCGCIIAENSEKVVRMVCGIPVFIKGGAE